MPLKLYQRRPGGNWHYRGSVAKKRIRGSTGTSDKKLAERIISKETERHWKSYTDGPASVLTFGEAFGLYQDAGKGSARKYLLKVLDHWKDKPVKQITAGAIKQAAIVLYPNATAATRNRQVIVPTCAVINHAAELGLCQNIKHQVKRFRTEKKVKEPAQWEWVAAFMSASSPHLGALACFMFLTGARISEALSLTWNDVDLSGTHSALIRQTKIGAERRAHLPLILRVALANIPGPRTGKVFRYSSRNTAKFPWRTAIKRAGIKPLTFHAMRHGFATAALRAGIDVPTVARLGGWATPAHVLSTYGHASEDPTLTDRLVSTDLTQAPRNSLKVVGE